jgi:hypothetical protein
VPSLELLGQLFLKKYTANVESYEAVLNNFRSALEVTIINSYWGYTGLLRYQLGHPPLL